MAPRLRVLAGTSLGNLLPISKFVNTTEPQKLVSERFEGEIVVNIKGFVDPATGEVRDSEYFSREDRQGITWSIQVRGRFLAPHSANDVLFGNIFERPLILPWGSSAALKFMQYIDPTLDHDLASQTKPWALSPLISTMPHFAHTHIAAENGDGPDEILEVSESSPTIAKTRAEARTIPRFPPPQSVVDDTSQLHLALRNIDSSSNEGSTTSSSRGSSPASSSSSSLSEALSASSYTSGSPGLKLKRSFQDVRELGKALKRPRRKKLPSPPAIPGFANASQRRSHFSKREHREAVQFGHEDLVTVDFCYGFLEFNPTLALRLPGGWTFDLMKYWDGQPVRFVCCERKKLEDQGEEPWGPVFWCVSIEMAGDENDG